MGLCIEIKQCEKNSHHAWVWRVYKNIGGKVYPLTKGVTFTADGAIYAAVMDARLYEPSFSPGDGFANIAEREAASAQIDKVFSDLPVPR